MKSRVQLLLVFLMVATLVSGCCCLQKCKCCCQRAEAPAAGGGVIDLLDPSPNSGTIVIPTASFGNNTLGGCFLSSQGWDKYFNITGKFCGPNVPGCAPCYTNANNLATLVVQTCDAANNTSVQTGIVLVRDDNPTIKVCVTNTPACNFGANLSIASTTMASGKKYRASIFYKSASLGGLTNITVKWNYQ